MHKKRPTKFHIALFLFGFILSAFPAIMVGWFSYIKASSTVQDQVIEAKQQSLLQIETHVEQVLKTADQSLTHFLNSGLVSQALQSSINTQQFQLYNQLKKELNHLQTFDTGISNIVLLSKQNNWYIDNSGFFRLDEIRNKDLFLSLFDRSENSGWRLEKAYSSGNPSEINHACSSNINLVKKLPLNSTVKTGLVVVSIPSCELNRWFSFDNDHEALVILDEDLTAVSTIHSQLLGEDAQAAVRDLVQSTESTEALYGRFAATLDSESYITSFRKSDYNNWMYLSIVPLQEITNSSRAIGWFTLILCFILLILSFLLSWVGSHTIYRPVQRLFNFVSQHAQAKPDKAGHDEFDYIREQIGSVILAKTELETKQISQVEQLKSYFISRLIRGEAGAGEIQEKIRILGLPGQWRELAVLTLQIDSLDHTKYQEQDTDLLLFGIHNVLNEALVAEDRIAPVLEGQSMVTILFNRELTTEQFNEKLYRTARAIQETIERIFQLPISIGISQALSEPLQIHTGYLESITALKYRFRSGHESVVFYHDLPQGYSWQAFYPKRQIETLCDAIMVADRELAEQLLASFFEELKERRLDPNEYEVSIARFLLELIQLVQARGVTEVQFSDTHSFFAQLFELRTPGEMMNWFRSSLIEPIISHVESFTLAQHQNISQRIKDIIHEEFDSELTLQSIAARLHYNSNYISNIFRKETGMVFSDYLAQYRHRMAKTWLGKTDMSVKLISERLQFHNSQNFIRSFRKLEGMTPGKYRELRARGEAE
jgi:YesN/AraC family two-component response regulator